MNKTEREYHDLIIKNVENIFNETPSKIHSGYYPGRFKSLTNKRDKEIFEKLYFVKPDAITGNGEVALFWLWNYHIDNLNDKGEPKTLHCSAGAAGNEPDLKYKNTNVEIKSYPLSENKKTNIGRFQGQEDFVFLVNQIFSFRNVVDGKQNTSSVLLFGYKELREAAADFCAVRRALHDNKLDELGEVFKKMKETTDAWDKRANSVGLKSCTAAAGAPGGQHIATELIRYGMSKIMGDKPGDGGYVLNVVGSKTTFNNKFSWHQVKFSKMETSEAVLALGSGAPVVKADLPIGSDYKDTQTFGFNGATFSANLMRLFPEGGK